MPETTGSPPGGSDPAATERSWLTALWGFVGHKVTTVAVEENERLVIVLDNGRLWLDLRERQDAPLEMAVSVWNQGNRWCSEPRRCNATRWGLGGAGWRRSSSRASRTRASCPAQAPEPAGSVHARKRHARSQLGAEAVWQSATASTGRVGSSATRSADNAAGAGARGTDFVVSPRGDVIPIPQGASGPLPTWSGKGIQYQGGQGGGNGLHPKVTGVRIMDPSPPMLNSPGYPNGYVVYMKGAQAIDPATGKLLSKSDVRWHNPLR